MAEKLTLLNTKVANIITIGILTNSPRVWSALAYYSTSDKERLSAHSLNELEKGNHFQYSMSEDGTYKVHTPFRVMDKELGGLLAPLKSLRSTGKVLRLHPNSAENAKNPRSCVQDFTIGFADMQKFMKICAAHRWTLEDTAIHVSDVDTAIEAFAKEVSAVGKRSAAIAKTIKSIGDDESYQKFCVAYKALAEQYITVGLLRTDVQGLVSSCRKEYHSFEDIGRLEVLQSKLTEINAKLDGLPVASLFTTGTLKYKSSVLKTDERPEWVLPLGEELKKLSSFYPCLSLFTVSEDTLVLELPGLKMLFGPKGLQVDGDVRTLRHYSSSPEEILSEDGARFRGLLVDE